MHVIKQGNASDTEVQRTVWNAVVDGERHLGNMMRVEILRRRLYTSTYSGYVSQTHTFGRRAVLVTCGLGAIRPTLTTRPRQCTPMLGSRTYHAILDDLGGGYRYLTYSIDPVARKM